MTMLDSVYDPFERASDEVSYFSVDSFELDKDTSFLPLSYTMNINLSQENHVMQRKRYSAWDALGDIGGFHDGLVLIFASFMGIFNAVFYASDLTGGKFFKVNLRPQ